MLEYLLPRAHPLNVPYSASHCERWEVTSATFLELRLPRNLLASQPVLISSPAAPHNPLFRLDQRIESPNTFHLSYMSREDHRLFAKAVPSLFVQHLIYKAIHQTLPTYLHSELAHVWTQALPLACSHSQTPFVLERVDVHPLPGSSRDQSLVLHLDFA
ncbi:hypothetical protein Salat_1370900 [Sesamum alatum]|uniref:Uncharacterized protein n=1 Tax=Sesamum alatum TaxID=300844 RepID=A0AAE1Y969_9LAMI|nr:hypothetical protein Salat_1370900 [Sesamum alatum]